MFDRDSKLIWEQYGNVLLESKQSIINLGYPRVIVDLLFEKYGRNSFIIAKWLKEFMSYRFESDFNTKDWFTMAFKEWNIYRRNNLDIPDLITLYQATNNLEDYLKAREEMEDPVSDENKQLLDLDEKKIDYLERIKYVFFRNGFFNKQIIKDIDSGKLRNIKEYSSLSMSDAVEKYNRKIVFEDPVARKIYNDGYKWIDVGPRCELVGSLMRNCGSSGVMSTDPDRTILTLFDGNNIPHILATYSPNEKRISGIQGQAGSKPKKKYHDYILDLEEVLDAKIDYLKCDVLILAIKSMLKNYYKNISVLHEDETWNIGFYLVTMNDDKQYITNLYYFLPQEKFEYNGSSQVQLKRELIYTFNNSTHDKNMIKRSDFMNLYNIPEFTYETSR
jgi:hypothetical protein